MGALEGMGVGTNVGVGVTDSSGGAVAKTGIIVGTEVGISDGLSEGTSLGYVGKVRVAFRSVASCAVAGSGMISLTALLAK